MSQNDLCSVLLNYVASFESNIEQRQTERGELDCVLPAIIPGIHHCLKPISHWKVSFKSRRSKVDVYKKL